MTYGKTQPSVYHCPTCNFMGYAARLNKVMLKLSLKKFCKKCIKIQLFKPKISKHSSN